MVGCLDKGIKWGAILVLVALALLLLLTPAVKALSDIAKRAEANKATAQIKLAHDLRAQIRNTRIEDPYDNRWWGKKVSPNDYVRLERALDDFFYDAKRDGLSDAALYQALEKAGVHVTNLTDAVHAANHLVNHGPIRLNEGDPSPEEDGDE